MEKVIHKYRLQETSPNLFTTLLPVNSTILTVEYQGDTFYVWAEIQMTNTEPTQDVTFRIQPTGKAFEPQATEAYLRTIGIQDNSLIFHVYLIRN